MRKGLVLLTIAALTLSSAPVTTWAGETSSTAESVDVGAQESADTVEGVSVGSSDDATAQDGTNSAEPEENVSADSSDDATAQEGTETTANVTAGDALEDASAQDSIVVVGDGTAEATAEALESTGEVSEQMPVYDSSSTVSPNVTTHTQDEIKSYVASHGGTGYTTRTYAVEPSTTSPYAAGQLSDETLQNALNRLNQIRYIAGLDEITLNDTYTEMVQAGTLVNSVNKTMSHYPEQPEDMSDELYSLGYSGCSRANLCMGGFTSPEAAIMSWMSDSGSSNSKHVGHRRWILNPSMGQTGYGSTGYYGAMYAFDRSNTSASQSLVTWPAQNMPVEYFGKGIAWSISVGTIVDEDSVKVTLTRRSDGKVWTFSSDSSDGDFYVNNNSYGVLGAIIFRPSDIDGYHHGDVFDVSITGLDNPISYSVSFFALEEENETPSSVTGLKIGGRATNALRLNWTKNTSADGYIIEQYKSGTWTSVAKISENSTVTYRVEGLSAGTTYQFRIRAFKLGGSSVLYSGYKYINGKTNPSAVSGLKIGGRATDALRLNWTKNTGASGYIIEQYKSGSWTRIAKITSGSKVTYRVENLSASTTYQFRIKAYAFDGSTALYSSYKKVSGTTAPTAVTGLKIGGKAANALRLNWTQNSNAGGYIIEQYKDGSWTRIARISRNSTVTYRVEGLSSKTTYKFRIKAFGFDGSTAIYSSYTYVDGTTN